MAQLPSGAGPFLIRFGGRTSGSGKPVPVPTPPPAPRPAPPPPPPPPPPRQVKSPRSALHQRLSANTEALRVAGGGEATGSTLAEIAKASAAQAAANGKIAAALDNIKGALGGPVTLGADAQGALKNIGDRLTEIKTAVSAPMTLGETERNILKDIAHQLGEITTAIEEDGSERSARGAALLAIATGEGAIITHAVEGNFFEAGKFHKLEDIAKVSAEEFVRRMEEARKLHPLLLKSRLVKDATRADLLIIHEAARLARSTLVTKGQKNPPKS
jgi:hypothetical protein